MSRTLSASDRKALIKMAGSLPVGSPERKAILMGLAKAPVVHRTRKFASAKLNGFERSHIKAMRDHLDRVERLIERVTLNDASDEDLENMTFEGSLDRADDDADETGTDQQFEVLNEPQDEDVMPIAGANDASADKKPESTS